VLQALTKGSASAPSGQKVDLKQVANLHAVHGTVLVTDSKGRTKRGPHAWLEFDIGEYAFVWDPEHGFIDRREFVDTVQARPQAYYEPEEVLVNAIKTGHSGPWDAENPGSKPSFDKKEYIAKAIKSLAEEPVNHWPDNVLSLFQLNAEDHFSGSREFTERAVAIVAKALDFVLLQSNKVMLVRELCVPESVMPPRAGAVIPVKDVGPYWSWTTDRQLGDPCTLKNPEDVYWRITAEVDAKYFVGDVAEFTLYMSALYPFGYEREVGLPDRAVVRILDISVSRETPNFTRHDSGTSWGDRHPTYALGQQFSALVLGAFGVSKAVWG
jgi:hypothetical protein